MKLLKASKLFDDMTDSEDEEARLTLVQEAEAFLRANGTITLTEWAELTTFEKAALAYAGDKLRDEQLARVAEIQGKHLVAAEILEPHDGGAAKTRIGVAVAVAKAAAKYQGTEVR